MGIRKRKPTSAGRRFQTVSDFAEITRYKPERSLTRSKPKTGGRNSYGRMTARATRAAATSRSTASSTSAGRRTACPPRSPSIEYDPNRNARIALLHYRDGEKRYIIAPTGVGVGDMLESGHGAEIRAGQRHGAAVHPGRNDRAQRRAEARCRREARPRRRRRRSSSSRRKASSPPCGCPRPRCAASSIDCRATIGAVGNAEASLVKIGKAGRNRWKGKRPHVRGVAMNPVDHPLGGGEGKSSGGRHPVSPWGKPEGRTRRKGKPSDELIVRRRRGRGSRR